MESEVFILLINWLAWMCVVVVVSWLVVGSFALSYVWHLFGKSNYG